MNNTEAINRSKKNVCFIQFEPHFDEFYQLEISDDNNYDKINY